MNDSKFRFETRALYLQVRDELVRRIAAGEWKPGMPIPNEVDLAKQFAVSMGTTRKALEIMESERIVTRRQGRGTFVNDHAAQDMAVRFSNLRDSRGRRIEGQLAGATQKASQRGTEEEIERLQLGSDAGVIRVRRVHHHDGRPFMLEHSVLPRAVFKTLPADLSDYRITGIAQDNGIIPGKADEKITIVLAEAEDAAALGVKQGTPLIQLDRVIFSVDGQPLEWRIARCHLMEKYYQADLA
jgi:GntR family transcriptional regulator